MILPPPTPRMSETGGSTSSAVFGISDDPEDLSGLLSILRDKLYSNKFLAVLREYATNAWDAHQEAGKPEVPIKVVLPTVLEPTLIIRDYGFGLSEYDIYTVYVKYGRSTKRKAANQAGFYGIGGKSAFSYSDQFNIISYHGGRKKLFSAVLDASNVGRCDKLLDVEWDEEDTGIEIRIPVRAADMDRFKEEARQLFAFFHPQPDIKCIDLPQLPPLVAPGFLTPRGTSLRHHWTAVMGCVPYRLSLGEVGLDLQWRYMESVGGVLVFEMGEVDIAATREDLDYTERTKLAVQRAIPRLADLFMRSQEQLILSAGNGWQRRTKARDFLKLWGFKGSDVPPTFALGGEHATLPALTKAIPLRGYTKYNARGQSHTEWVPRTSETGACEWSLRLSTSSKGFAIVDTTKPLRHFELEHYWVLEPKGATPPEEVKDELLTVLPSIHLDGAPIVMVSSLAEAKAIIEREKKEAVQKAKYKGRLYKYVKGIAKGGRRSDQWELTDHLVEDGDVVVLLEHFLPSEDLVLLLKRVEIYSALLGEKIEAPIIYGLRVTARNPRPDVMPGIRLHTWKSQYVKKVYTRYAKEFRVLAQSFETRDVLPAKARAALAAALGREHPLVQYYRIAASWWRRCQAIPKTLSRLLLTFKAPQPQLQEIPPFYPLLNAARRGRETAFDVKAVIQYVRQVDAGRAQDEIASTQDEATRVKARAKHARRHPKKES